MAYAIYLRKSRKDAELEALGIDVLERHEKTLLELAKALGFPIGAIYHEVVSGDSIDARPVMQQVLSEVEAGMWDGILVMEVERLARGDTIDQGRVQRAFFYSNTLIVTPVKIYDPTDQYDNEYFEFSLFMSRREYQTIKRRLQEGRVRSSKDGYYCGSIPPYGWKRILADDKKHYTLTPDETEGPVLLLMYDLMGNKKYGFSKTCSYLTDNGIMNRLGKPFTPSTVKGIISNPANIGMIRWNHRKVVKNFESGNVKKSRPKDKNCILVKGKHKAAVDLELFTRANVPKSAFSAPVNNDKKIQNIFAGILYCSCCGRTMVRKKAQTKTPYDYLICPYTRCETVSIKSEELEQALIRWLEQYISSYNADNVEYDSDYTSIDSKKTILENLQTQLETLIKQRSSLFDFLEQGVYSKEIFIERSNSLENRIAECQTSISSMEDEIAKEIEITRDRVNFIPKCKKVLKNWNSYSVAEKNTALKELIEKIDFTKTEKNTRLKQDAPFSIIVHPKVSKCG